MRAGRVTEHRNHVADLTNPPRVDHTLRKAIEVASPRIDVRVSAYDRGPVKNLEPVIRRHQLHQPLHVASADAVHEADRQRDGGERSHDHVGLTAMSPSTADVRAGDTLAYLAVKK